MIECLGNSQYSFNILIGVKEYIQQNEKYHRLKCHFLRSAISNNYDENKKQFNLTKDILKAQDSIKPFKYKEFHFLPKRYDLAKYPINLFEIPEITKKSFDEKFNYLNKMSHSLKDMVILQKNNINKKVEMLKKFAIK